MRRALEPNLRQVADLLLAAEEASPEVSRLAWYLVGRDPLTGPLLTELQVMAKDAHIPIGSPHWAFGAVALNQEVDRLLSADGRTWKRAADLLDPEGDLGIDYPRLVAILEARIARFRGDTSRLRRIRARIVREATEERAERESRD